jgi:formylglycine-generating enzyme required for sulfatase activity
MTKVFISYSREDVDFARQLADDLIRLGMDVWLDVQRIRSGENWANKIQEGLDTSETMLLIVSPESMASSNVADEWQYYHSEGKRIIPIMFKPSKIHFQLKRLQYVSFHENPYQTALDKLCAELGQAKSIQAPLSMPKHAPAVIKRPTSLELMPKPFAWMPITAGKVTIKEGGYVHKGGQTFEVAAFQMAKYPITNAQYAKFIAATGYKEPENWHDLQFNGADYPVVGVNWHDALAFCQWISEMTGEKISLPTEQQWQWAAVGNTGWDYPYGPKFDAARCNSSVGIDWTHNSTLPVTMFEGKGDSPFKVVDMSGNVWEWCLTDYDSGSNDINKLYDLCILRGGSWGSSDDLRLQVDFRLRLSPHDRNDSIGFRISLS